LYLQRSRSSLLCCMLTLSKHYESIADMLQYIDQCCVFNRSVGKKPSLLLDGRHSRLEVALLEYINGDGHEWTCCLGVPYVTHLWQVADSPYLKANFKIALTTAKKRLFEIKSAMGKNLS
jgi:hypothetical protein